MGSVGSRNLSLGEHPRGCNGAGSRTFEHTPFYTGCLALRKDHWVVNDLNIRAEGEAGERRVIITCEGGGDFPGSWDDLIVRLSWTGG